MLKVRSVAVFRWKVHEAVLAMVLSMPVMGSDVSGEASLTCMHITSALVRRPAMGEQEVLSLLVQLLVGVLLHQAATWIWCSGARCSRTR